MAIDPEAWRFLTSSTDRRAIPEKVVAALLDQVATELNAATSMLSAHTRELNATTTMLAAHDKKLSDLEIKLQPLSDTLLVARWLRWMLVGLVMFVGAVWALVKSGIYK